MLSRIDTDVRPPSDLASSRLMHDMTSPLSAATVDGGPSLLSSTRSPMVDSIGSGPVSAGSGSTVAHSARREPSLVVIACRQW